MHLQFFLRIVNVQIEIRLIEKHLQLTKFQIFQRTLIDFNGTVMNQDIEIVFNPKERLNRTTLRNVVPNLAQSIYEKIIKEKEKNYYEHLSHTKLNQSVVDILLKYYKTNKTVLVTNCREDRALITLDHHNLTDKFYKLLFRKVSQNGNPVNKYKNAILSLNLSTQRVIVIENETQEIEFALIAGIPINNIFKY